MQGLGAFLPLILLILIMYFLLIRPQKKREKQVNEMRNSVQVGDEVVTIGGICGKIVKTKDDTLVIQVGADKLKFEVMRWAISKVVEPAARPRKERVEEPAEEEETPKKAMPKRMKKAAPAAAEAEAEAETPASVPVEEPEIEVVEAEVVEPQAAEEAETK